MSDQRQALHELVEQASEEHLPELLDLLNRFLRPLEFPVNSEIITFSPVAPGMADEELSEEAEIERKRQYLTWETHLESRSSQIIREHRMRTKQRLGMGDEILAGRGSQSVSIGAGDVVELNSNWLEGTVRNSLSTFSLQGQEIIVFETTEISEPESALIFKARVLTPKGEAKGELKAPLR
jgi:hypothetical protein